jgi:hypothetical protein
MLVSKNNLRTRCRGVVGADGKPTTASSERAGGDWHVVSVEYHATMESCSDKFHVNIPNVV